MQRALVCIKAENCIISRHVFKVQIMGQAMIYNRSIEGSGSLPPYKAEVTIMLKDMDFGVYGKGSDGYVHYSLAMDRIREEEENRKALMDEFGSIMMRTTSIRTTLILMTLVQTTLVRMISAVMISDGKRHR